MLQASQSVSFPCVLAFPTAMMRPLFIWSCVHLTRTPELHSLFCAATNQLGGPGQGGATPKGILKLMGIPELTIFHVRSAYMQLLFLESLAV